MTETPALFESARSPRARSLSIEARFVSGSPRSHPRKLSLPLSFLLLCVVALLCSQTAMAQNGNATVRGSHSASALPNFRRVNERLFRGGQPREGGLALLAAQGIDTIVNLRGRGDAVAAEEAEARALGLRFFSVEMPRWGRPTKEQVTRVLELIRAPKNGRVFVHCKDGVDRTGTVVACYRITHEGWTAKRALDEARDAGMRWVQFWMRDYVGDYADGESEERGTRAGGDDDWEDRAGDGVRVGEKGVSKGLRATEQALRTGGGSVAKVFDWLP